MTTGQIIKKAMLPEEQKVMVAKFASAAGKTDWFVYFVLGLASGCRCKTDAPSWRLHVLPPPPVAQVHRGHPVKAWTDIVPAQIQNILVGA